MIAEYKPEVEWRAPARDWQDETASTRECSVLQERWHEMEERVVEFGLDAAQHVSAYRLLAALERATSDPNVACQISCDPAIQEGRPVIRGTRLPIFLILEHLSVTGSARKTAREYAITREQVHAAVLFAASLAGY